MEIKSLLSMGCLAAGLWYLFVLIRQYLRDRKRELVPAIGHVVYMEQRQLAQGRMSFTPVYEYLYGNQRYCKVYGDSTRLCDGVRSILGTAFVVGSAIPLLVDQNDPEYAVVNDYSRYMPLWQMIVFVMIGLFCFG